jgi:hypothetical protein
VSFVPIAAVPVVLIALFAMPMIRCGILGVSCPAPIPAPSPSPTRIISAPASPVVTPTPSRPRAAEAADIQGMPIRIGDTVRRVQDAYRTTLSPEPVSSVYEGATGLRLQDYGVWFFFDKDGKIYTIRLDAPFNGTIKGIRIGDTMAKLTAALGPPASTLPNSLASKAYIFRLNDESRARFDLDDSDRIKTVLLFK